jgi:tRNA pseudouridine55 synthase
MSFSLEQLISRQVIPSSIDFNAGCLLLVDKPLDWTSFDAVNKIRFTLKYALDIKKIKVGHAGTLDPLASGLLLICVGKYTKGIQFLQGMDKEYTGTITIGHTTATYDAEVEPNASFETNHISEAMIYASAKSFIGPQMQLPPIYSAVKVKGQTAYSLARRGKTVELKERPIVIHKFDIISIEDKVVQFRVNCSKGTYIRSLAHDFGKSLHSGAYLSSLRRTKIGDYDVKDAYSIEDIKNIIDMLASGNQEG